MWLKQIHIPTSSNIPDIGNIDNFLTKMEEMDTQGKVSDTLSYSFDPDDEEILDVEDEGADPADIYEEIEEATIEEMQEEEESVVSSQ